MNPLQRVHFIDASFLYAMDIKRVSQDKLLAGTSMHGAYHERSSLQQRTKLRPLHRIQRVMIEL